MKIKTALVLLTLFILSACGSSPSEMTPGDYHQTITVGSDVREYILHVPANYDGSKALPLVFILHGGGGTAESMVTQTGMNEKADQEGFFVAYLQGLKDSDGKASWNTGINPQFTVDVDDVAFVRDLANQLTGQLKLDSQRIYAAGFSAGGGMSHRLAAELPDLLASVAVVEGSIGTSLDQGYTFLTIPEPKGPISMVMIHGFLDPVALYDGGMGGKYYYKSVAEAVALWSQTDGCTDTPPAPQFPSAENIQTQDFTACANGTEVELIAIGSGVHQWPTLDNAAQFVGTDAIWDFFSRHSKANAQ